MFHAVYPKKASFQYVQTINKEQQAFRTSLIQS